MANSKALGSVFKLNGFINVKDPAYGAKGDGSTDDSAAIQAAITALPARGGLILVPFGTYILDATITLTKPVVIYGMGNNLAPFQEFPTLIGPTCFLKKSTLNGPAFKTSGGEGYCGFENFHLDGQAGNGGDGIRIGAPNNWVRNVVVTRMGNDGIRIGPNVNGDLSNGWRLDNVWSKTNTRHGVFIEDDQTPGSYEASNGTCTHLFTQTNSGDGIRIGKSTGNTHIGGHNEFNTGFGVRLVTGAGPHYFFGVGMQDGNNGGTSNPQLQIDAGAEGNLFVAPGLHRNVVTDNGTRSNFLFAYGSNSSAAYAGDQPTLYTKQDIGVRRIHATGTAVVSGDFALGAGWGDTASIASVAGTDTWFEVNITSNGASIAANPTVAFTYKDGAFSQQPRVIATWDDPAGSVASICNASVTTSIATLTPYMTPTSGRTYTLRGFIMGSRGG